MTTIGIEHLFAMPGIPLPPITGFMQYIVAANGLFVRARRPGLEALILAMPFDRPVQGLDVLTPYVKLDARVPLIMMDWVLNESILALPNEALFWFLRESGVWIIHSPDQIATPVSVVPVDRYEPAGASALIDLHTHGTLPAFFSPEDNADETGFRIYAVIGQLDATPQILVRVGVFGYYCAVPADEVFELPEGIEEVHCE
jgi:PRTRC genetic system protein A